MLPEREITLGVADEYVYAPSTAGVALGLVKENPEPPYVLSALDQLNTGVTIGKGLLSDVVAI
ncbi:unannotated protein [freshwater metagenome]|uniref:Unannotated protein n=1 Tax=freshwater metagenome TaxID=449393 RepID=A0A6J6BCR3_9ZZZZ